MLLLLLAASAPHAQCPPTPAWLYDITRVAYTDLPNAMVLQDWPDKVIPDFAKAGVQMMFSRVQSGSSWDGLGWRGQYGAPVSTMEGDGTRHVVELCHKHGIRYIGYYWAQREPQSVGEEHPEYLQRTAAGKPTDFYCFNHPDYRELVKHRIVELVRDWHVDGIFFDMYHPGTDRCYCDVCRAKFKVETGDEPPAKEDLDSQLWQQWTRFKQESINRTLLELNQAIKAVNPEAVMISNTWNAWVYRKPGFVPNAVSEIDSIDAFLEEIGWYDRADPKFFAFPARHNFMSFHLAGLCRGKRAFMWSSGSNAGWPMLDATETGIRVMTMLTNGCVPSQSVPGRDVLADYMSQVAALEPVVKGAEPYPWCGLVVSQNTELWYGKDDPLGRYVKGVYGAFQTMLERHLPVSLVSDHQLAKGDLPPYRVLFLPNVAAMSEAEMETIRRYVEKGGAVVATHETSLFDEHGVQRDDFGLADVLGTKFTGRFDTTGAQASRTPPAANLWISPGHPWENDPELLHTMSLKNVTAPLEGFNRGIPVFGRMLKIEPVSHDGAQVRIGGAVINPQTKEKELWSCLGVVEHSYGKGRSIYLPWDISEMSYRWGFDWLGRVMELALRDAATAPPPVEVSAPSIVQAMTYQQGDRLVVHLLNDISSFGRSQNVLNESRYQRREVIPIHDIKLTFPKGTTDLRLWPGDQALDGVVTAQGVEVTLPPLGTHCAVSGEPG